MMLVETDAFDVVPCSWKGALALPCSVIGFIGLASGDIVQPLAVPKFPEHK